MYVCMYGLVLFILQPNQGELERLNKFEFYKSQFKVNI